MKRKLMEVNERLLIAEYVGSNADNGHIPMTRERVQIMIDHVNKVVGKFNEK